MQGSCEPRLVRGHLCVCPFEVTLEIIGGKWKMLILYFLAEKEILRFGELRRLMPSITERMLSRQLRLLEQDGIIARKEFGTVPPRVDYSLTKLGFELVPVMQAMRDWGLAYPATKP